MQNKPMRETEPVAVTERENARRAALSVIGIVGSVLIFKMTAVIDIRMSIPSPVVYGISGALYGAICGAAQRAEEAEDRVLHTLVGAIVLGLLFAVFSLGGPPGPRKYRLG